MIRECEIKFELHSELEKAGIQRELVKCGARACGARVEIDYVSDTEEYAFRSAGLLIRYRQIEREGESRALITLKVKGEGRTFQDNFEYEYDPRTLDGSSDREMIGQIIDVRCGIDLRSLLCDVEDLEMWIDVSRGVYKMTKIRSFVEKRRDLFRADRFLACIDVFPDPVGTYLELEATSPSLLEEAATRLSLDIALGDPRTYGEIVGQCNAGSDPRFRRVALSRARQKQLASWLG